MRLGYALELVLAIAVGLGLARYRLTWLDLDDLPGAPTWVDQFEVGADAILAGVVLVGGLATLLERLRRKSPVPWGPGRQVWFFVAVYLILTQLDKVMGSVALGLAPGLQSPIGEFVMEGLQGRYGEFLPISMAWVLLALGLTLLASGPPRDRAADAREWAGRAFAAVLVCIRLALWALTLHVLRVHGGRGGGG